jgi:uncharacterized membrane protein
LIIFVEDYKIDKMKWSKNGWMVPAIIIIVNVCAIWIRWSALADVLPAHFDPAGNASGSMAKTTLIFYPVISLMLCLVTYGIYTLANNMFKLRPDEKGLRMCGLHVMASCLTLTVLSSTLVTLTMGTCPLFMFAEPILILAGIVTLIVCLIKAGR